VLTSTTYQNGTPCKPMPGMSPAAADEAQRAAACAAP
jgi:hypothetical protein